MKRSIPITLTARQYDLCSIFSALRSYDIPFYHDGHGWYGIRSSIKSSRALIALTKNIIGPDEHPLWLRIRASDYELAALIVNRGMIERGHKWLDN